LGTDSVSARDFAKFTDRRDWPAPEPERLGRAGPRSLEALARQRARKADRRDDNGLPSAPPAEPTSPPDFSVRTLELGHWSADGRYFVWNPPRPKFEEQAPRDVRDEWWAQSLRERSK
jgi:hypothetical protein